MASGAFSLHVSPDAGLIATLRHGDGVRSFHFPGRVFDALMRMVALCEWYGLTVVSISTPGTIYRDLHGSREYVTLGNRAKDGWTHDEYSRGARKIDFPERNMLGRVGRADLYEVPRG